MPLPIDQLILIVIIAGTTTLYISNWLPTEVTSTLAIAALVLTGILSPDQALSGFASTATVTVAAMFVLSAGLMRTGALEAVTLQLGRFAKGNATRLLVLLAAVEIPASAFMKQHTGGGDDGAGGDLPLSPISAARVEILVARLLFCNSGRHLHTDRHQHQHPRR
jgi:di/tricarboxylate transporter